MGLVGYLQPHPAPICRAEYECFQIELSKNYGMTEWREDVKKVLLKAGLQNLPITFLFLDTQVLPPTTRSRQGWVGAPWLRVQRCRS